MAVVKYPGAKNSIAHWIVGQFPHNYRELTYLEPFFGSGAVFFAKEPSTIETINDRDSEVSNLFIQIRENPEKLIFLLENTPWSKDEYLLSFEETEDETEKARRFLVRTWFSRGSNYRNKNSMRMNIKKSTGDHERFHIKLPDNLLDACKRLKHKQGNIVQIENRDAFEIIPKYDRENVMMYLDPPYVLKTRKHKKIYNHEMTNEEHEKLLIMITELKAKVLISGYENDIYLNYLKNWNFEWTYTKDEGGNKRKECLWFNYNTRQKGLFTANGEGNVS